MNDYESSCRLISEYEYQCHNCRSIFRSSAPGKEIKCPACGGTDIGRLPSWAPLGFDSARVPAEWEYECQQCHNTFKLLPPSSPSQEKEIICPACRGCHILRLTTITGEPIYCG